MADKTYIVSRAMSGDKEYARGDERTMSETDATHLVQTGALVEKKPKPAPAPKAK